MKKHMEEEFQKWQENLFKVTVKVMNLTCVNNTVRNLRGGGVLCWISGYVVQSDCPSCSATLRMMPLADLTL